MIKLSIITVTYNSEKYIEQTILSVINQHYSNIEYILIDGGSKDNTIKIIDNIKNLYHILFLSQIGICMMLLIRECVWLLETISPF